MPPKRPRPESSEPEHLDFHAWKAYQASAQRQERALNSVYEPSREDAPDHMWYSLDHAAIESKVASMCQSLLKSVRDYEHVDQEISDLVQALDSASIMPVPVKTNIAVYKIGAPDDTTISDIEIEFLNQDEIREFVEEQIRRYADVYSPSTSDDQMSGDQNDSDMSMSSDDEDIIPATEGKRKISDTLQRGADTAHDFFRIIFGTRDDDHALEDLQSWLQQPDLEDGRFLEHCVDIALEHLAKAHATDGSFTYGDLNQTRTAVVNEYRRKANFEMVVAKSDRFSSSTAQDRYLTRAIRQHEARNTILVLNKADSFLTTSSAESIKLINSISEEPFTSIKTNLEEATKLDAEDPELVQTYRKSLIKDAQLAFIRREASRVQQELLAKGKCVEVFSVSAGQYMDWREHLRVENPLWEPEVTGIPSLRCFLLTLPAEASYQNLTDHVFEVLSDINDQVSRVLKKFEDDDAYAGLRTRLKQQVLELLTQLKELSDSLPHNSIPRVWDEGEKQTIMKSLEAVVDAWRYPQVHWTSFRKMLRENGTPINGKLQSKNLNEEVQSQYKGQLKQWREKARKKTKELVLLLDDPVQDLLQDTQHRFDRIAADPELKQRANEALRKAIRRILIAREKFETDLKSSVKENYLLFTTEHDVYCPVAREMKSIYSHVSGIGVGVKDHHSNSTIDHRRDSDQNHRSADPRLAFGMCDIRQRSVKTSTSLLDNHPEPLRQRRPQVRRARARSREAIAPHPSLPVRFARAQSPLPGARRSRSAAR
ncbi:hypothetical protein OPT61_g9549 [Boeremia exigua]|uniref:Uncharacterized protein n=1 Tax=Boeremia exigua TaxID=749465 RepID=A0ACC2HTM2_9PLEO|nr:hypothetical protein OPT61_g9549 [Boeremia exigua]